MPTASQRLPISAETRWIGTFALILLPAVASTPVFGQQRLKETPLGPVFQDYCLSCHNPEKRKGKLDLESMMVDRFDPEAEIWDDVAWMLQEREMPPLDEPEVPRPSHPEYSKAAGWLDRALAISSRDDDLEPRLVDSPRALLDKYCVSCHNAREYKGELDLDAISGVDIAEHPESWERVIRRLETRQMPPSDRQRPSETTYDSVLAQLSEALDERARARPNPGRVDTFRRLNRTEYRNAVRDLLGLEIDASELLPKDEESHGFDNVTLGTLSPVLLDRYILAAHKVSRLAVGRPYPHPGVDIYRIPADVTQEHRIEGLPVGTRGGALISHYFPQDGEYEIQITLARGHNEEVEGLEEPHELEITLDRSPLGRFVVEPPEDRNHSLVDKGLKARAHIPAGSRKVGAAFLMKTYSLLETKRQPFKAHFNASRHPRLSPAVYQISIIGPYEGQGARNTLSRRKIFIDYPEDSQEEVTVARRILGRLMKRAFRRPIANEDFRKPMELYRESARDEGFEAGIEAGIAAILAHPEFMFRIEREPPGSMKTGPYRVSETELATRLSFFLWSSLPDEDLLDAAIDGRLGDPEVLSRQTIRMLGDPRSRSLVHNFASQWLHLRNLESARPDMRRYPDFDDNLRQSLRKETELFFQSVIREDRSVLDLLKADYTFLDGRLAQHYGIPGVFGSRFRRVSLNPGQQRGGLLRHGSILTVTSYATRTSPVIRGNWILENFLGSPAPPPPPEVPALEDKKVDANLPMRERLAEHRANPACANCHDLMDPIGFALENFDAVGRWRNFENGTRIDASGSLPHGSEFVGVGMLEDALLERPELFVRTLTEKLLTFALGRGVAWYDAPAIRKIVRDARSHDYRFSSIVLGIARSVPFQMRNPPRSASSVDPSIARKSQ